MHDLLVVGVSLVVGVLVGLTGMGGGALLTPLLVLVFGVPPLGAVSSDLAASLVMRPVGAVVHLRRGTVAWSLVGWLLVGSVPCAFAGVLVLRALGSGPATAASIKVVLGAVVLLAGLASLVRRAMATRRGKALGESGQVSKPFVVRALPTVGMGAVAGLLVGMTSVGSGSLMLVGMMWIYPQLSLSELVGTDLVQAVPLLASAVAGHLLFGDVRLGLTTSLVIGGIPGAYLGARLSTRAPERFLRSALVVVLLGSGLALLGVGPVEVAGAVGAAAVLILGQRARRRAGRARPPQPSSLPLQ